MTTYVPPANLDDLAGRPTRAAFLNDWHGYIYDNFTQNIAALGPHPLFFSEVDEPAQPQIVPIGWNAFPLALLRTYQKRSDAWKAADQLQSYIGYTPKGAPQVTTQYRPQDEYCEWHAYTEGGKLKRIVFTAEGPEYWIYLAEHDFDAVVGLYKRFVDSAVQPNDLRLAHDIDFDGLLLKAGSYNPFNRWNTTDGVMHLTHPANTLGAEINLAAFATALRKDRNGNRVDDVRRLICCSHYGSANRSSDPSIGFTVNTTCVPLAAGAAPQKATLANPVGLYMQNLQPGTLTGPSGEPLDNWFTFVRGANGKGLMAVLEASPGAQFGLDQVSVKNVTLERGGQIAEAINMVLYAQAKPYLGPAPTTESCRSLCCMPASTPDGQIKNINLKQPNIVEGCQPGDVPSYRELVPDHAPAAPFAITSTTSEFVAGHTARTLRTRLLE